MPDLDEKNLATRFQKKAFTLGMSLIIISLRQRHILKNDYFRTFSLKSLLWLEKRHYEKL
jgi:hypothetical protein